MSVYVVTHKTFDYKLPTDYKVILVGANNNIGKQNYIRDNVKVNISDKNESYCELTAIYWIWKNVNEQSVGISHYRRYFSNNIIFKNTKLLYLQALIFPKTIFPMREKKLKNYLNNYDWVVPTTEKLDNLSVYDHFAKHHNIKDLNIIKKIINEYFPEYMDAFNKIMQKKNLIPFNMFYTKKQYLNNYCEWLFKILEKAEEEIDISQYDSYQKRVYGFLAERLFNVYLEYNNFRIKYIDVYNSEIINKQYILSKLYKPNKRI